MSSINRLFVCLRCTTGRLSVSDVVLKKTKLHLWGSLLIDSRANSTAAWPRFTRALTSQSSSWQPIVRGYRTARPETTGFSQNIYDETEVCMKAFRDYFYRAMHFSAKRGYEIAYCPSVCPSGTFRYCDHIGWNSSKIISRPNSLRPSPGLTPKWAIWCNGNTPKIRV